MTADHGDGAGAQTQTSVPAEHGSQAGAQNVLHADHNDGDTQEHKDLLAALLQQTEAGSEADAAEEDVHEQGLNGLVESDLQNTSGVHDQVDNGENQTADDGSGDAAALQESALADDEAAQDQQQHGDSSSLVHVQCDSSHVFPSFSPYKLGGSCRPPDVQDFIPIASKCYKLYQHFLNFTLFTKVNFPF